jgi:2-aminoadipate transaminase
MRLDGPDVPSVKGLDTTNEYVIYTSTFSKPCSPGIRVGYGLMPRDLMSPALRIKGNHDFGSANLNQHIALKLLTNGSYDRHVLALRNAYRIKRDAMLSALKDAFYQWPRVQWIAPLGGMYCWVRFPDAVVTGPGSALMEESIRQGVLYVPGQFCHVNDESNSMPTNQIRLCYGVATTEQIDEGVHRLAKAAKRLDALNPPSASNIPVAEPALR